MIDSLDLSTYNTEDSALLEQSLKKFHGSRSKIDKINALTGICDNMMHDDWMKFQFYQLQLISNSIRTSSSPKELNQLNQFRSSAYINVGYIYKLRGNITSALSYYDSALVLQEKTGDKSRMAQTLNNIGVIQKSQGNVPLALEYYHKALKLQEELKDTVGIANSYFNIGALHQSSEDLDIALKYYYKALKVNKQLKSKRGISNAYNNIGTVYREKKDYTSALKYFLLSIEMKKQIGDSKGLIDTYINLGGIYELNGDQDLALQNFMNALNLSEKINNAVGISNSSINLARLKLKSNELTGQLGALELANNGFRIANEIGYPGLIRDASEVLYQIYEKQGKYKESLQMNKLFIQMRDSVLNIENQRVLSRKQAQYEYEKQKAIDDKEHDKEIALEKEEKEKQKIIIYASIFGLILVVSFLIYAYQRLQITKRQKRTIEIQKNEIVDSINYAKRLQEAILPKKNELFDSLKDGFILYLPKDIVAGDFYWKHEHNNYKYIAVADCTGHGVPGAMVSVVCATSLDRAVTEFGLSETDEILNKVTELVIETFEKSGEDVKDGMDISLARINLSTHELQYSGAYNPLWILSSSSKEIISFKGDRQPVGKNEQHSPFSAHKAQLSPGDWVFQFTDGYVDQFGGENGKKYRISGLKNKLESIKNLEGVKFHSELENEFNHWKGKEEQIDDICVIGWRLS